MIPCAILTIVRHGTIPQDIFVMVEPPASEWNGFIVNHLPIHKPLVTDIRSAKIPSLGSSFTKILVIHVRFVTWKDISTSRKPPICSV